ncbi:hypothetical protein GCM10023322_71860 [Rugosimonospora acidiphila]|uniref:Uncharacterized protein n=1 Tax=Rugosimonospora acidiphila TaxID=556531 RepID=A0ABP9SL35_9ACTN
MHGRARRRGALWRCSFAADIQPVRAATFRALLTGRMMAFCGRAVAYGRYSRSGLTNSQSSMLSRKHEGGAAVASIDQIISQLQSADQKVNEGMQLLSAAENAAGQLQSQMASVGVQDKAAQFAQVRESIQRIQQHLQGSGELTNQSINMAKSAGG